MNLSCRLFEISIEYLSICRNSTRSFYHSIVIIVATKFFLSSSISPSIVVVVVVHVIDLLSFNLSIIFLLPKCISIWYWFIISLSNKSHTHFETHRFIYFIFSFILGRAFTQNLFSFYFSIHQSDDVVCCIKGLTKSVCWWWCKIKKRKKKLADAINKANNQISIHLSSYRCSAALLWNAAIFFPLFRNFSTLVCKASLLYVKLERWDQISATIFN